MYGLTLTTNTLDHYMAQINQYQLLDRETERELALRYRNKNDLEAAQNLICSNLRFVVKVAHEYRAYGLKLLDLIQEGNIGLMKAVKKFDPARNNRLISYAVWWIRAYIHNFIINSWSMVKIGTTQARRKLFFKLKQTQELLQRDTGELSDEAVAAHLHVNTEEVREMSARLCGDQSLDAELVEGEGQTWLDRLPSPDSDQEHLLIQNQETQNRTRAVELALKTLDAREQEIIQARILADSPVTLQHLAERFSISRERIRQIEKRALQRLRACMEPEGAE
ncbi:MAG: RNA polymerase sigma factor RpoH [Desulfuromonadaceae bacterium]|nr:RNA polymerase sigma factor RpoH [Desulfuromonadaceae bacterium]